jgi:uncharacterized protein with LGFP repeats
MGVGTADLSSIFDAVKKGFEAAEVAIRDFRSVVEELNGARSVVVTVANNTPKDFQLQRTHHDHGGFATPAAGIVKSKEYVVFGSQNSDGSIGTGTEGSVTYAADGLEATLKWDNPFIGSNSADADFSGPKTNAFRVVPQAGAGNQKAQIRFDLFEIEMRGFDVFGAILDKWAETRWGAGPLGFPTSNELPTFDGVGRFRNFERGIVSWHPETGPHIVWGLIGERWLQIGREQFGYPISDETATLDARGRFNHFRAVQLPGKPEASIFWHPDAGAHEVYGAIRAKWAEMGWERSHLGYPVSAEQDQGGGRLQQFQGGSLFWTPHGGTVVR